METFDMLHLYKLMRRFQRTTHSLATRTWRDMTLVTVLLQFSGKPCQSCLRFAVLGRRCDFWLRWAGGRTSREPQTSTLLKCRSLHPFP